MALPINIDILLNANKVESNRNKVPDYVTHKNKTYHYYIRYNSSTLVAKGELEQELFSLSNQIPFDDRPNLQATYNDLSKLLLYDYLVAARSRLSDQIASLSEMVIHRQFSTQTTTEPIFLLKSNAIRLLFLTKRKVQKKQDKKQDKKQASNRSILS